MKTIKDNVTCHLASAFSRPHLDFHFISKSNWVYSSYSSSFTVNLHKLFCTPNKCFLFNLYGNTMLFCKSSIFHNTSLQVLYFKYECNVVSNTVFSNTFVQFKKNIILCMAVFGDNTMFKTYFSSQALFYASVLSYRFVVSVKQLIICNNKPFQNWWRVLGRWLHSETKVTSFLADPCSLQSPI